MCVECILLRTEYDRIEKACRNIFTEVQARRSFPTDYHELTVAAKQAWHDLETVRVKFGRHRRSHVKERTVVGAV
jgi:hypothetical protein